MNGKSLLNNSDIKIPKDILYIISFLAVMSGILCAFIGFSTCLHIVLILGKTLSDGLAWLNPFILAAFILILGGWLINLVSFWESEK